MKLRPFWCWVLTGHRWDRTDSKHLASRTMNTCVICGKVVAGTD